MVWMATCLQKTIGCKRTRNVCNVFEEMFMGMYNHQKNGETWAFVSYLSSHSVCWFNMLAKSALLVSPSRKGTGGCSKERSKLAMQMLPRAMECGGYINGMSVRWLNR